jgi:hypothetical protein
MRTWRRWRIDRNTAGGWRKPSPRSPDLGKPVDCTRPGACDRRGARAHSAEPSCSASASATNPLEKELDQITAIAQRALGRLESSHPTAALNARSTRRRLLAASATNRGSDEHVEPAQRATILGLHAQAWANARSRLLGLAPQVRQVQRPLQAVPRIERARRRPLPPADPRTIAGVQGQSRASP